MYTLGVLAVLENRSDQIAKFTSDDDASREDGQAPNDGQVACAVFRREDLSVDESDEEILLRFGGTTRCSTRGREEASLC